MSSTDEMHMTMNMTMNRNMSGRVLTYLGEDDPDGTTGLVSDMSLVVGFSILAAAFGWTAFMNTRVCRDCQNFYEWNAIRLILPGISWILGLECATLALDSGGIFIANQWKIALYMLEATVAPGMFLSTFVVTFLAYRTRSIPFFFIERGPGRSTANEHGDDEDQEVIQALVRPATMVVVVRLFSLALFLLTLIVNFDVVWETNDLAGRTGWRTVLQEPWSGSVSHIFLSLLPMALVSVSALYFSLLLWRYGSFFSMVIYPSVFNPWISPVFGTICLMVGQLFGPDLFPILSNAGILLYMMCIVRVLYEVRHDMKQAGDLGSFLDALGDDAVTGSVTPNDLTSKWGTTADDTSSSKVDDEIPNLPSFH
jgi:hypothetical protein